jgi:phenylacetaldehyde dehydrogenase
MTIANPLTFPDRMLIGGEWRAASDGQTFDVYNPATGQVLCQVPAATEADVDAAVRSARQALTSDAWRGLTPYARERLIHRLADLLEANGPDIARLESTNQGKLVPWAQAIDVDGSVQWLRYMAGWCTKIEGLTLDVSIPFPPGVRYNASTRRVPVGVVGAIVPWNFPLAMAVWKLAPALAAGNTVVLKPAEETPLTALRLAALAQEAGFPPGVLNVITGDGPTCGAALVRHPGVDKITFTGSTEVGRIIGAQCGRDIRRCTLELGGKSPVIVLDDMDVETAVAGAAGAIFFNHGQVCTAGSRLYVADKLYDKVVAGVADVARSTILGAGTDPTVQMGPLVSAEQQRRVMGYIDSARKEGGEILVGGEAQGPGYFVRPTVVANTANKPLTVVREEIFGPVLVAMPFSQLDDVLREANATAYGLGASVWTHDLRKAHRAVDAIEAGTVWVNTHNMVDPNMPFGGFKQSGIGREHGRGAIESYTEVKSVCIAY